MASTPSTANDWTIGKLLAWTKSHFELKGLDEPRLCAELLLAKAMGCKRIELYARFTESPTEPQRAGFRELVRAAAEHQPIAYLIGAKEFYSLEFTVSPVVLIPRPETELIVERALAWCKERAKDPTHLLDIGTGSGCIAIAIAKHCRAIRAIAADISAEALEVARANAARHGISQIEFVQADLLTLPPGVVPEGGFDVIVCNPPYIATGDAASLPSNVRDYEPHAALFAGDDGLSNYRRLAADVRRFVQPDGLVVLEVGAGQAGAVAGLFVSAGLPVPATHKDAAGLERALEFRMSP